MSGPAVKAGYAAASTDGGHSGPMDDLSWALTKDRTVNWDLLQNFATRSLADQVYVGKTITEQFYGKPPHHSYWNGCSMGGRQGYMMAQKYPDLLDGIMASAPSLSMTYLAMGDYWPQIVMQESRTWVSNCEFKWFAKKTMEACDMLDGVRDNVITDPEECTFDPQRLVGEKIQCDGKEVKITTAMADVVQKIFEGPKTPYGGRLWFGLPHGTDVQSLANISIAEDLRSANPFGISSAWLKYLVLKDPKFNLSKIDYGTYAALWTQANQEYDWILNADNADLTVFRKAGGKLLSWHGINDQLIPYTNTLQYRNRVEKEMGGPAKVNEFYRLFLAPGVAHCGGGTGPMPTDALDKLVEWVEHGEAPETLDARTVDHKGELWSREICVWPKKMKYMGFGDAKRASSWSCEGGEELEGEHVDKGPDFLGGLKDRLLGLGMGLKIN
ncbi:tannase and feruloyl esterase [Zopfia rhizophila CBS 207.26]|uniref:Carboxylic ester hydrolase n=1 Tax=Zopfia rhizophila CBS 207.26 TaxID=1314779 RepID=A0A6A6ELB8_9PEZI|nr:tannase and feruloyl esterase [Zopfia rhizophila CBS 207.26]